MIDNHSKAAVEAMRLAQQAAERSQRSAPTTADLVRGVVGLDRGIGARALTLLGLQREEVVKTLGSAPPEEPHRLRAALVATRRLAGTESVNTGHLLVGALTDPQSAAAQALATMGVHVADVHREVTELVAEGIDDDVLPARQVPIWLNPNAELHGAVLPGILTLIHTADAAVHIDNVIVYPSGFEFRLLVRTAPSHKLPVPAFGPRAIDGPTLRIETASGSKYLMTEPRRLRPVPPAGMLITGVMPEEQTTIDARRRADFLVWCWPLPHPEPLEMICDWPAFNIVDARARIDGNDLRAAAALCVPLWPGT